MRSIVLAGLLTILVVGLTVGMAFGTLDVITPVGDDSVGQVKAGLFSAQTSVDNGTAVDLTNGKDFVYTMGYCQASKPTGTDSIVINIQSDKIASTDAAAAWANVMTPDITLDSGDSDSLQFNFSGIGIKRVRGHVTSGADLTNTVTLDCWFGR